MFARRHWIPPAGLVFAQLCHGLSWALALWIALAVGVRFVSLPVVAWIHLVALGWVTIAAFSVLLHAIPAFLDIRWRYETTARWAVAVAGAAIACFVIALLVWPPAVGVIASVLAIAMSVYLVTTWMTLGQAYASEDRVDRAVARAFAITFVILFVVVILGVALAWMLAGAGVVAWIARLPGAHGNLALFGWLTLLIYGVSARTLRPITGVRTRWPKIHIAVGSATLLGAPILAIGVALGNMPLSAAGGLLIAIAATCYIADVADILMRATVPNRPPQAFVAASLCWLGLSVFVGAGVLLGAPWQLAYGFLLLAGWVGQMVNAHMFHIGVRLISTVYRGDDDETRPQALLDPRISWRVFLVMQVAVFVVLAGLVGGIASLCAVGAGFGFLGWVLMIAALAVRSSG